MGSALGPLPIALRPVKKDKAGRGAGSAQNEEP